MAQNRYALPGDSAPLAGPGAVRYALPRRVPQSPGGGSFSDLLMRDPGRRLPAPLTPQAAAAPAPVPQPSPGGGSIADLLMRDPEAGPLDPQIAGQFGDISDRITGILSANAQPSLQDISSALLRNASGRQSFGEALSGIQTQRRQTELQDIDLALRSADALIRQNEVLARQGHPQARALKRAMDLVGFDQMPPDRKAAIMHHLDALPGEVTPETAFQDLSQAIQETTPAELPEIVSYDEGMSTITDFYDPSTGQLIDRKIAPRFKPESDRPRAFNMGDTLVDEEGNVIFREEPQPGEITPRTDLGKLAADLNAGLITQEQYDAEIARLSATDLGARFDDEASARTQFRLETSDYSTARFGVEKVIEARNNPSPAGDLALIFGYMKVLDPTSVVRETEFATAESAGSVPTRIWNLYNRVLEGTRLTPEQRADFAQQAVNQFQPYQRAFERTREKFETISRMSGLDPDVVIGAAPPPLPGIASPPLAGGATLPVTPGGTVDAGRLVPETVYTMPTGEQLRWTGSDFETVDQ